MRKLTGDLKEKKASVNEYNAPHTNSTFFFSSDATKKASRSKEDSEKLVDQFFYNPINEKKMSF